MMGNMQVSLLIILLSLGLVACNEGEKSQSQTVGSDPLAINATATTNNVTLEWEGADENKNYHIYQHTQEFTNYNDVGVSKVITTASNSVTFRWKNNDTNESNYIEQQNIKISNTIESNDPTKIAVGIKEGVTYYFRIFSTENTVTTINSESQIVKKYTVKTINKDLFEIMSLDVVVGLSATATSSSQINLTWERLAETTGYKIYRYTTANFSDIPIEYWVEEGNTTSYIDYTDILLGTTYYYKVIGVRDIIESPLSKSIAVSVITQPAKVTGLFLISEFTNALYLKWDEIEGATDYKIYYKEGSSFNAISDTGVRALISTGEVTESYLFDGFTSTSKWFIRVLASNASGDGELSDVVSTQNILSNATNLSATADSSSQITLTWTGLTGLKGYHLYRYSTADFSDIPVVYKMYDSNITSYIDNADLSSGKTYYYKLTLVSKTAESHLSKSTAVSVITQPAKVTGLFLISEFTNALYLKWEEMEGATDYKIYYKEGSSFNAISDTGVRALISTSGVTESYLFDDFTSTSKWFIKALASNASGDGELSDVVSTQNILNDAINLSATANSSSQITLTWTGLTGLKGYQLYRYTTADFSDIPVVYKMYDSNITSYIDNTDLSSGKTYYYKLTLMSKTAESHLSKSTAVSVITQPAKVTGLFLISEFTNALYLKWKEMEGATDYKIYYKEGSSFNTISDTGVRALISTDEVTESYLFDDFTSTSKWFIRVLASNASGDGELSDVVSTQNILSNATNLSATANSSSQITLTWTGLTGLKGYQLYRYTTADFSDIPVVYKMYDSNITSYIDNTDLSSGKTYYYKLTLMSKTAESHLSKSTAVSVITQPAKVTHLVLVASTKNSLEYKWDEMEGAISYTYSYSTFTPTELKEVSATTSATGVVFTGLATGTKYFVNVLATNSEGEGEKSDTVSNYTNLNAVTNLSATVTSSSQITVTWTKLPKVERYKIYRYTTADFSDTPVEYLVHQNRNSHFDTINLNAKRSYNDTDLLSGMTYYYKVIGYYASSSNVNIVEGLGILSESPSVKVTIKPAKVIGLVLVTSTKNSLEYKWNVVERAVSYTYSYSTFTPTGLKEVSATTSATGVVFTGLATGTKYFVSVLATSSEEEGESSDTVSNYTNLNAITNLSATVELSSKITVTWAKLPKVERYKVYRYTTADFSDIPAEYLVYQNRSSYFDTLNPNAKRSYNDTDLVSGMTYYYKVIGYYASSANVNIVEGLGILSESPSVRVTIKPSKSTDLTLVKATKTTLEYKWDAMLGATDYKIYYKEGSTFSATSDTDVIEINTTSGATGMSITGLTTGTQYFIRVLATNTGGDGELSAVANIYTTLSEVTDLSATTDSSSQITLTWSEVARVTGYKVYRSMASDFSKSILITTITNGATTTNYTDTGLVAGTTYYYKVTGTNISLESPLSKSIVVNVLTKPAKATGLTLVSITKTSFNYKWNMMFGATDYKIYYKAGSTFSATSDTDVIEINTTSGATGMSITGLTTGTQYFIRVLATNTGGDGELSAISNINTISSAPTKVSVNAMSISSLKVEWTKVSNVESYTVYYSTMAINNITDSSVNSKTVDTTSLVITDLIAGTNYYIRIKARTITGGILASGLLSNSIEPTSTKVAQVMGVVVTNISATNIFLNWDTVVGATSYKVYYGISTFSTTTQTDVNSITVAATQATISDLNLDTIYYYGVTANNNSGEGVLSTVSSTRTLIAIPTKVRIMAADLTNMTITWDSVANEEVSYSIYHSQSSIIDETKIASELIPKITTGTSIFIDGLIENTQYYVRVKISKISNRAVDGKLSNELIAYTLLRPPSTISASSVTSTSMAISWSPVLGASGYKVCYDINVNPKSMNCINTDGKIFYIHTVNPHTKYHYKVLTIGKGNTDGALSTAEAITFSFMNSTTVTGFHQDTTEPKIQAGEITFNWDVYTDATNYNLYYEVQQKHSNIPSVTALSKKVKLDNVTTYTLTNLNSNNPYSFSIQAETLNGTVPLSTAIIAAPLPTTIAVEGNVSVSYPGTNLTIHTSKTADCDLTNTGSCIDYLSHIVTSEGMSFVDNNPITTYYQLSTMGKKITNSVKIDNTISLPSRSKHQVVVWNNELYLIGGCYPCYNVILHYNDVWKSSDGFHWTLVTSNANFPPRSYPQVVVWNNELYLIGGQDIWLKGLKNDVWKSSDGANWTLVTSNANFSPRSQHQVVVWNDELYLIAGGHMFSSVDNSHTRNDVWKSSDGLNWTLVTDNADFGRLYNHQAVVFNNKLYVIGGYNMSKGDESSAVWESSNGSDWKLLANGIFDARSHHQVKVWNNKLYMIGGIAWWGIKKYTDIWESFDGITWTFVGNTFDKIHDHQLVVWNNELYIFGGYHKVGGRSNNHIWKSSNVNLWSRIYSSQTLTW